MKMRTFIHKNPLFRWLESLYKRSITYRYSMQNTMLPPKLRNTPREPGMKGNAMLIIFRDPGHISMKTHFTAPHLCDKTVSGGQNLNVLHVLLTILLKILSADCIETEPEITGNKMLIIFRGPGHKSMDAHFTVPYLSDKNYPCGQNINVLYVLLTILLKILTTDCTETGTGDFMIHWWGYIGTTCRNIPLILRWIIDTLLSHTLI